MSGRTSRRRIAYVYNHSYFLGGGEISLYELVRYLDKQQYEPIVIVPGDGPIADQVTADGIKVYKTHFPPIKQVGRGGSLSELLKLTKLVRKIDADIIHVNGSRVCFYAGIAGRILNVPIIWHVRETVQDFFLYDGFLGRLAKGIVCVSKGVQVKRFGRFGKWIQDKIFVVYNGIDTNKFTKRETEREKIRTELDLAENEILFGVVGNIIPLKGQDFFLQGVARAKKYKPDLPVKTLIIGRVLDANYNEKLLQFVIRKGLEDIVIFQNYSEKLTEIYSALDVFVLLSQREGFSRSLLEAMSSDLPILATRIGEIEEAVVDGENGFLVDYSDVDKLAYAIIELSENKNMRREMGQYNRRRATADFDLKSHVESTQKIYDEILTQSVWESAL